MVAVADKTMAALEMAAEMVPLTQDGWATALQVQAFIPEVTIRSVDRNLHTLVQEGRAEHKGPSRGMQEMWRPSKAGGGAGGMAGEGYRYPGYDGGRTPGDGGRTPGGYDEYTFPTGGGGTAAAPTVPVPLPTGDIVRSVL